MDGSSPALSPHGSVVLRGSAAIRRMARLRVAACVSIIEVSDRIAPNGASKTYFLPPKLSRT
jgi:hypothetical protein